MASYNHYQPAGSLTWTINHNLDSSIIAMDVMELSSGGIYTKRVKASYTATVISANTISITFPTSTVGRARIVTA